MVVVKSWSEAALANKERLKNDTCRKLREIESAYGMARNNSMFSVSAFFGHSLTATWATFAS